MALLYPYSPICVNRKVACSHKPDQYAANHHCVGDANASSSVMLSATLGVRRTTRPEGKTRMQRQRARCGRDGIVARLGEGAPRPAEHRPPGVVGTGC
jgi:hypothetical protein